MPAPFKSVNKFLAKVNIDSNWYLKGVIVLNKFPSMHVFSFVYEKEK